MGRLAEPDTVFTAESVLLYELTVEPGPLAEF
jgi:hypothetical protein